MRSDNANGGLLGLFLVLILFFLVFFLIMPAFCKAAPPTPEGWGFDFCSLFR
jgi:hypothetical protein